jgi:hypothetical protein
LPLLLLAATVPALPVSLAHIVDRGLGAYCAIALVAGWLSRGIVRRRCEDEADDVAAIHGAGADLIAALTALGGPPDVPGWWGRAAWAVFGPFWGYRRPDRRAARLRAAASATRSPDDAAA